MNRFTVFDSDTGLYELAENAVIEDLINAYGRYEDYLESLSFGKLLEHARRLRGLSQKELADKLKVTQNTISYFETEKRKPSHNTVQIIAVYLDAPLSSLMSAYKKTFFSNVYSDLGSRIRNERAVWGWTLEEVSKQTRIPVKRLRRIEESKGIPDYAELMSIARCCMSDSLAAEAKRRFGIFNPKLKDIL